MKDFQGYRQKKNNEFAQQKAQRLELRNGKKINQFFKSYYRLFAPHVVYVSLSGQGETSILASLHDITVSVANGVCLEE